MQVVIDGSGNITDWDASGNTLEDGIEFPYIPRAGRGFPTGFTVEGTAPNRVLTYGGSFVAGEVSETPLEDAEYVTAANVGASGEGVYKTAIDDELQFRKLVAGTNVSLTGGADTITIDATGSATAEVRREEHAAVGATETVNVLHGDVHVLELSAASCEITFDYDGPAGDPAGFTLEVVQDGTGGRAVTFANVTGYLGHGTQPVLAIGANQRTFLDFFTPDGGTTWYGVSTALLGDAYKASGALYETYSRQGRALANVSVLSSGRLSLVAIDIPIGVTVSSITFVSGSTGITTPTGQWFELRDSSRNLLRKTVDDTTTAWAATTVKTLNLTAPFTTTYGGLHYLGICVVAATPPALIGAQANATALGIAPILNGNSNTGLTYATAPATADAITAQGNQPWAYAS